MPVESAFITFLAGSGIRIQELMRSKVSDGFVRSMKRAPPDGESPGNKVYLRYHFSLNSLSTRSEYQRLPVLPL